MSANAASVWFVSGSHSTMTGEMGAPSAELDAARTSDEYDSYRAPT